MSNKNNIKVDTNFEPNDRTKIPQMTIKILQVNDKSLITLIMHQNENFRHLFQQLKSSYSKRYTIYYNNTSISKKCNTCIQPKNPTKKKPNRGPTEKKI